MEINIRVEGDSEGFVEFECPFCNSEFKLNTQEYNDDESKNLFCPYCGLEDEKNKFYTSEIIEQANNIATNYLYEEINKVFGKMSKSFNKNKMIQVKYRPLKKINIKDIK